MILLKYLILGFLTALLFPPYFMLPLGFIIFPYLHLQIFELNKNQSKANYFVNGFVFGFGFLSIFLFWIINPFLVYESTKSYFLLSFLLIFILSLIFGISFILFKFTNNTYIKIISIPIILVFIEVLVANLLYGFPWLSFALIISNNFIGLNLIKYFGTHFTSFLIILVFLSPSFVFFRKKIRFIFKFITLFFIFFIVLFIVTSNYFFKNKNDEVKNLSIELFQMNNQVNSVETNYSDEIYNTIIENINSSNADLLIFAENNYPYLVNDINNLEINSFLKDNQKLIIGATRVENGNYYNSILVLEKNISDYFDKKILVPFGEFLPMRKYLKFLEKISGTSDFSIGSKKRVLKISDQINFIPIICYEVIFFWRLINAHNNEADILINITNDGWFGNRIGPYQHFYLSKLRASEFNKYLLRVSNNGISGIIDNKGNVISSTNLNAENKIQYDLKFKNRLNLIFFHKYFNLLLMIIMVLVFSSRFIAKNE